MISSPQNSTHRKVRGSGENVEYAAANREFATTTDHVHAFVCHLDEIGEQGVEVEFDPLAQGDGAHVTQSRRHRLHEGTHRGDHHTQWRIAGVRESVQDLETLADDLGTRRESFMGKRLPRRELGHR